MLVCTCGKRLRWIGGVWGGSVDTTKYTKFSPHRHALHVLTWYIVYSKELERDVTTTAMAKAPLRLKTLAS